MLLVSAIFIVGALACSVAPTTWALSLSRVVLGFAVGGATQTIPMYVAELAPAKRRGQLVLTFQVGIGVGIVASTIIGASQHFSWRVSLGLAAVPATLMLLLMLRLPESPRWLVKRNDHDSARKVLGRIRPAGFDVSGELQDIVEVEALERTAGVNRGWHGCGNGGFARP
jgi:MFS family permease